MAITLKGLFTSLVVAIDEVLLVASRLVARRARHLKIAAAAAPPLQQQVHHHQEEEAVALVHIIFEHIIIISCVHTARPP
jgi:hypothetical protein